MHPFTLAKENTFAVAEDAVTRTGAPVPRWVVDTLITGFTTMAQDGPVVERLLSPEPARATPAHRTEPRRADLQRRSDVPSSERPFDEGRSDESAGYNAPTESWMPAPAGACPTILLQVLSWASPGIRWTGVESGATLFKRTRPTYVDKRVCFLFRSDRDWAAVDVTAEQVVVVPGRGEVLLRVRPQRLVGGPRDQVGHLYPLGDM